MTKCMIKNPGQPWHWGTIGSFKDIQRLVGGYIEAAPICWETCTVYVNEEGKLQGLQPNMQWMHEGRVHDVLVGAMVVVGPPDEVGSE